MRAVWRLGLSLDRRVIQERRERRTACPPFNDNGRGTFCFNSAPPRIDIVVLSYNGLDDTRKCLESLHAAVRPDVLPLLVDNGSTDGTAETVAREFPWCRVVRVAVNRGPIVGNNAGIEAALEAGAEWIVLLNNDTTVDPRLFDRLMEAAAAHPDFDVLQPVIYFMDNPDVVMTDGCN